MQKSAKKSKTAKKKPSTTDEVIAIFIKEAKKDK